MVRLPRLVAVSYRRLIGVTHLPQETHVQTSGGTLRSEIVGYYTLGESMVDRKESSSLLLLHSVSSLFVFLQELANDSELLFFSTYILL